MQRGHCTFAQLLLFFLVTSLPGIACGKQSNTESESKGYYTSEEINQVITDFKRLQPKLEKLAQKEAEISDLLNELEKLVAIEFDKPPMESTQFAATNVSQTPFPATQDAPPENNISPGNNVSPGTDTSSENVTLPALDGPPGDSTPDDNAEFAQLSAAERFRMMQQPTSSPEAAQEVAQVPEEAPQASATDMANMTAAERFRMMQQVSPPKPESKPKESTNIANTQTKSELVKTGNETSDNLTAAEQFKRLQQNIPRIERDTPATMANTNSSVSSTRPDASKRTASTQRNHQETARLSADYTPDTATTRNSDNRSQQEIARNLQQDDNIRQAYRHRNIEPGKKPLQELILPATEFDRTAYANQIRGPIDKKPDDPVRSTFRSNRLHGNYYLHLFSYKSWSEQRIRQNWESVKKSFPQSLSSLKIAIKSQITEKGKYNRMYLGPLHSDAQATDLCIQLRELNYYCKVASKI